MIPKINLDNYLYNLPDELIALHPLGKRDESNLLVADPNTKQIKHFMFKDISNLIPDNSLIVWNNTKVITARILTQKVSGGSAEVFLIAPIAPYSDPLLVLNTKKEVEWDVIIGGKKIKENSELLLLENPDNLSLQMIVTQKNGNEGRVKFNWKEDITFGELLDKVGKIPLPPYIKRDVEKNDEERYQTVYSKYLGSVAAPTAGLHFTNDVVESLKCKNCDFVNLTLHVGLGTFAPINTSDITAHQMHNEQTSIDINECRKILDYLNSNNKQRNIICVGTTSLRTLETIYWIGYKLKTQNIKLEENMLAISQWEPYQFESNINFKDALESLIHEMEKLNINKLNCFTELLMMPGYKINTCDELITNFHASGNTLILLVAGFVGDFWKSIYQSAIENKYRFFSYGDSSYLKIIKNQK